ncbi:sigma-70 family RNA polymerase sigma factor, partial [Mycetocola saprophilus]|uniref:sigma-70 family RNA polymerase sigma factor n=1 Tax=Mycetocola saprophilus TaxID=76636 RepID=UPI003BF1F0EB
KAQIHYQGHTGCMEDLLSGSGVDRDRLVGVAYRMLGSVSDANDAVQEAYVRWYRLDENARASVKNPAGWFVKTTSRICLDVLKSASRRHDIYVGPWLPEPIPAARFTSQYMDGQDPADQTLKSESLGMALLTVMERMSPGERVAFVLRDVFEYPISDIAEVLERSPGAVRQLASSARARLNSGPPASTQASNELLRAFQHAAVTGDVARLVRLLHPEVKLRSDGGGVVRAALNPIHGPGKVARFFIGVLARQAPATLTLAQGPTGDLGVFTHHHTVTGVVELIVAVECSRVIEVLIQWNPSKLQEWVRT